MMIMHVNPTLSNESLLFGFLKAISPNRCFAPFTCFQKNSCSMGRPSLELESKLRKSTKRWVPVLSSLALTTSPSTATAKPRVMEHTTLIPSPGQYCDYIKSPCLLKSHSSYTNKPNWTFFYLTTKPQYHKQ